MLEIAQAPFGFTVAVTMGYVAVTLWLINVLRRLAFGRRKEVLDRYVSRMWILTGYLVVSLLLLLAFLAVSVMLPGFEALPLFLANSILTPLGVIWATALIRRARKQISSSTF